MNNFKIEEFECPCCEEAHMSDKFLDMIDDARDMAQTPFKITSGYRCARHNIAVGGKPLSAHTKGLGADIACSGSAQRHKIVSGLLAAGFNRIGVAKDFVHADCDPTLPPEVMWTY